MTASDFASAFAVYISRLCLLAAPAVPLAASDTTSAHRPSASPRIPQSPPHRALIRSGPSYTAARRATRRNFPDAAGRAAAAAGTSGAADQRRRIVAAAPV